jgi:hypothetical protein
MVTYPNLPSVMRPPNNETLDKGNSDADKVHPDQVGERNDNDPTPEQWSILKNYFITHADLNYFVLDLKLSKSLAEILALRLKGCNLLQQDTTICCCHNRMDELTHFFTKKNSLVFCNDAGSLMKALGHQHNTTEWRVFVEFSNLA